MSDPKVEPSILFAPLEKAILEVFAVRSKSKTLASLRPLVWIAYLALAQWFGLAHLITPEMRSAAIDAARRPGRRGKDESGQTNLLDLVPLNDGRPGIYVSFVRLKVGNVRGTMGMHHLDLAGCHEPSTAIVRAYEQGWIAGPDGNGLRFLPPSVWSMVVAHNLAGFSRREGVNEYITTLESRDRQWQESTDSFNPEMAKSVIDSLKQSIAESARITNQPIETIGQLVKVADSVGLEVHVALTPLDEKTTKFRSKSRAKLTENEEPREPAPTKRTSSPTKQSKTTTKKTSSKGRKS